jgi:hypothetical protein
MGILRALCLGGPLLLAGRARSGMVLFGASAMTLLFFPIPVKAYDYRFVIPGLGPLFAAGALAAWGLGPRSKAEAPSYSGRCARATPPARDA